MTAAMVMGLSVPVFAADYASYTAKSNYTPVVFDAAKAETKTVTLVERNGASATKEITLITIKEGSSFVIDEVPGNDPFVNVARYVSEGSVYKCTGFDTLIEGFNVMEKGNLYKLNETEYVTIEGGSVAAEPAKPAAPAQPAAPAKPAAPAAQKATANPTDSKVMVDGKVIAFDAYNINGNNYFKLRDVAQVVSGSAKQFAVTWDGSKNSINLVSGDAYASVGTELAKGDGKAKQATLNTAAIYKDGAAADLTAYTINGNNYFKLRDLGQAFDFNVAWDGANNCIMIDTAASYAK